MTSKVCVHTLWLGRRTDLFADLGSYVTFDIVLGSLYAAIAVIEAYGVFAAVRARELVCKLTVGLIILYPGKRHSCQDLCIPLARNCTYGNRHRDS
jgi:hypothetical protein